MDFVSYEAIPRDQTDTATVEQWKERARYICDDLHKLLRMDHRTFWHQVINDESLHRCIDSYLRSAPRCSDMAYQLSQGIQEIQEIQRELHRLVYVTCIRMATHKESKQEQMSQEDFGSIIYDNYIFDIPKLMDICSLYGMSSDSNPGNKPLLSKMMANIFQAQPQYIGDLEAVVPTILHVFENMCSRCGLSNGGGSPQKLAVGKMVPLDEMLPKDVEDLIFCVHDSVYSIWLFLDVYNPASAAFTEHEALAKLSSTYEMLFPALMKTLNSWSEEEFPQVSMLIQQVRQSQLHVLKTCHLVLMHNYLTPLLSLTNQDQAEPFVEGYMNQMSLMLTERRFLCHLQTLYPFREDRDILLQTQYPVDDTRLQYIMDAINESIFLYSPQNDAKVDQEETESSPEPEDEEIPKTKPLAGASRFQPAQIESMITAIKDLLPDLGDGFIQYCLEEKNYSTEETLNMLLENTLPTSLQHLPKDLPRIIEEEEEPKPNVLAERRNIFENDEFDIMAHDNVDMDRIHLGKKDKNTGDIRNVLNDKSAVRELKPLYDKYGHEDVESMYDHHGDGEYEDEYDDTYDTNMIGAADTDNMEDLSTVRRFNMAPPEEEEEETEEEEERKRNRDFVEDPAKIRERQAERRATMQQNKRGRGRPMGRPQNIPPQPMPGQNMAQGPNHDQPGPGPGPGPASGPGGRRTYDVKGGTKGQGQSADVLRNRNYKDKHKSSRANHNRRNLADKKRKV